MQRTRGRRALTLFELLVLIALVGLLLALLLPAIERIRLRQRMTTSCNNLRQIALVCLHYNAAKNHFPSGQDVNDFSAFVYLLPYLEQTDLYRRIDRTRPASDLANATAR